MWDFFSGSGVLLKRSCFLAGVGRLLVMSTKLGSNPAFISLCHLARGRKARLESGFGLFSGPDCPVTPFRPANAAIAEQKANFSASERSMCRRLNFTEIASPLYSIKAFLPISPVSDFKNVYWQCAKSSRQYMLCNIDRILSYVRYFSRYWNHFYCCVVPYTLNIEGCIDVLYSTYIVAEHGGVNIRMPYLNLIVTNLIAFEHLRSFVGIFLRNCLVLQFRVLKAKFVSFNQQLAHLPSPDMTH